MQHEETITHKCGVDMKLQRHCSLFGAFTLKWAESAGRGYTHLVQMEKLFLAKTGCSVNYNERFHEGGGVKTFTTNRVVLDGRYWSRCGRSISACIMFRPQWRDKLALMRAWWAKTKHVVCRVAHKPPERVSSIHGLQWTFSHVLKQPPGFSLTSELFPFVGKCICWVLLGCWYKCFTQ